MKIQYFIKTLMILLLITLLFLSINTQAEIVYRDDLQNQEIEKVYNINEGGSSIGNDQEVDESDQSMSEEIDETLTHVNPITNKPTVDQDEYDGDKEWQENVEQIEAQPIDLNNEENHIVIEDGLNEESADGSNNQNQNPSNDVYDSTYDNQDSNYQPSNEYQNNEEFSDNTDLSNTGLAEIPSEITISQNDKERTGNDEEASKSSIIGIKEDVDFHNNGETFLKGAVESIGDFASHYLEELLFITISCIVLLLIFLKKHRCIYLTKSF